MASLFVYKVYLLVENDSHILVTLFKTVAPDSRIIMKAVLDYICKSGYASSSSSLGMLKV